jgi:hypothetical protein
LGGAELPSGLRQRPINPLDRLGSAAKQQVAGETQNESKEIHSAPGGILA